jgi:hypothetical protein
MISQSEAKIFLAEERICNEHDGFRSYHTFQPTPYKTEGKDPFGPLYRFDDLTLAGNKKISMCTEDDADIILLPVVGAIHYQDSNGNIIHVEAGQAQICTTPENTTLAISNPYEQELVNFLMIGIKHPFTASSTGGAQVTSFNLSNNKNRLIELYSGIQNTLHKSFIGKISGRQEYIHQVENKGIFIFVIEGAFEVQYRLLEARDGLALCNIKEMEIEALSNDAIILLIELPVQEYQ